VKDFVLARAWAAKGRFAVAIEHCRRGLEQRPEFEAGWRLLAELLLINNQVDECQLLCARFPDANGFDMVREFCQEVLADRTLVDHPEGRLSLIRQRRFASHRSGWGFALDWLQPLHHQGGTLFDGFLESSFVWTRRMGLPWEGRLPPYNKPWVGFLHNPMEMPSWYPFQDSSPGRLLAGRDFQESLPNCRGLYALSDYLADYLKETTGKPVETLLLPTEFPAQQFDPQRFMDNPQPKIIQIGWWLRRLSSIFRLPIYRDSGYEKIWLVPAGGGLEASYRIIFEHEGSLDWTNVRRVEALPNADYDLWLSENLAFVHLYDASANNAVVECIARGTPLLINPVPAAVEYLGRDYPFYFDTLQEAADKARDRDLIVRTHEYLLGCPSRTRLQGSAFLKELRDGDVYQGLSPIWT
jgi:hypothetical protein